MASLSRQLAQWVANLRYEDLPPEVIDRAKGVTLHNLISALIGSQTSGCKDAVSFVTEEESTTKHGATVLVNGAKVTKTAAAYANTEMMRTGGKLDSYRMLTHPGTTIIPGALVAAETNGASGRDFITGIAAGYEVMGRIAGDFIPTLMSRGFHPSPVFGLFGAAVAAAKILRMTEEQVNAAIGFCVSLAASNVEGPHSGGRALREGAAARNAVFAVSLAQRGHPGGETVLEGKSGFYHSYIGNNFGKLAYSFTGETQSSLEKVTAGLGKDWLFLETLYRIYSIAGYNIAHVAIAAKLCEENDIKYEDIDRIEAMVNWLETQYPSPAFPHRTEYGPAQAGGTAYYTAFGAVKRGFPLERGVGANASGPDTPKEVLDLMKRVTIIPLHEMTLFGPRITIFTKDGKSYTQQGTGREFVWDFEEEVRRMRDVTPVLPISAQKFESLIATCRDLEKAERADKLIQLTL